MNIIKATLDTRHQNGVVGIITQFDNATLELQILTDGEVGEAWNSPEFELIAIKRDMNSVREVEQDKFTILSKEDHKVRIYLKEQFLTCRGTVKVQLAVKDGSRLSTTLFYLSIGQSLDHDIVTSIRDVEVLDQLDLYVAQGFRAINEATEITGELKKEMTEINNEASRFEKERQASELTRNQRELVRVDNEEDRVANEIERVDNENERITNEEERVANENTRITNENNRRTHENTRISQEAARQEAERQRNAIFEENENIRNEQENTRIKIESERKKKFTTWEERETIRLKSEENRILQERERVSNEDERKRQETTRQEQENYRQRTYTQFNEAEASRIAKEAQRESAEQQRQQAENERDANYQTRENKRDTEYGKAEEVRNNAFNQNEANRQNEYTQAERERIESEELRKGRERDREISETKRQEAETARANAESGRVERFNQEIEQAKNTMDTVTSNVNNAILEANDTMQGIEQRAEDCLPIIEKSASAKVDYMGNEHNSIKDAMDSNVEFVLDEVNTVRYEGQHITATDTIERQVKSAILKGNTLVNLQPLGQWSIQLNKRTANLKIKPLEYMIKPNTKYILKLINKPSYVYGIYFEQCGQSVLGLRGDNAVVTTKDDINGLTQFIHIYSNEDMVEEDISKIKILLIEYQEGMETWDIPYFEGMQSVRIPVLKSIGKNLVDISQINTTNAIKVSGNTITINSPTPFNTTQLKLNNLVVGNTYTLSCEKDSNIEISVRDKNGLSRIYWYKESGVLSGKFICDEELLLNISNRDFVNEARTISNIQIEQGIISTSYEHYKSNILMVNEDVTLRGIGEVKDGFNLLTGELTQRIKELVLNGSESGWFKSSSVTGDDGYRYALRLNDGIVKDHAKIMCDKFVQSENAKIGYVNYLVIDNGLKSALYFNSTAETVDEWKAWLAENNVKVQYQLATESVKAVDLNNQKVYSYDETTHYTCSSEDGSLIPTLSIDVPTNLPALVSRQRETIETQKEQIQTLEIENTQLIEQNEVQDIDIALNQDAINFMLFAPSVRLIREDKGEVNAMAAYLANQILKGKLSYELVVGRYAEFKEDIDTILILEGKQDLIK